MSIRVKFILAIIACLSVTMYAGGVYLQSLQTDILEQEARNRVKIVLNFTHATRSYVEKHLRPVLEHELHGKMILEGMSATFVTRTLIDIFREQMPTYVYKQATLNPLNLANQADDFEVQLIKEFQNKSMLRELTGYRNLNGEKLFYLAQPIQVQDNCLQCHSEPQIAPEELVKKYGDTHGFHWKTGEIVSALLLYVPTTDLKKQATVLFNALLMAFLLLTAIIIIVVYILFEKLVNRRILHITEVMEDAAAHLSQGELVDEKGQDEIGRMALAFNQMSQQLQISFRSLEEKNKQLEVVNQLKNEFLGIVAHDLKNPLSIIQSVSMDIECCYDDIGKTGIIEYASMIQLSSHQMFELISNLLEVNVIESDKIDLSITLIDIVLLARSVLNVYQHHAASKQIQLNLESNSDSVTVYADEHILRQVLDNLISNALKYSPPHKKITIKIIRLQDKSRCEVQDEGPGLSALDQEKLFTKFSRLTPRPTANEHSTGLGLFIVKKFVEAMAGRVWCETELGQGANFIVELPRQSSKTSCDESHIS